MNLDPGVAIDNIYTIHYFVTVTINAHQTTYGTASLVVAIETNDGTGSGWIERTTNSYNCSYPSGPPPYSTYTCPGWSHEQKSITVAGLGINDSIRLKAKSFSTTNGAGGSFAVRGGDGGGSNPETYNGVTYTAKVFRSVAVRAELPERQGFAGAISSQRFFVKNRGRTDANLSLGFSCTVLSNCSVTPASFSLVPPGESRVVTLTYTLGVAGTTGTGMVKVFDNFDNNTLRDSASVTVKAVGAPAPVVSVVDVNPGSTLRRDLCVTIAAGPSAAIECGDLRIVHALPTTRALSRSRTPTLLYNSAHAELFAVVPATVTLPSSGNFPDSVEGVFKRGAVAVVTGRWVGGDWGALGATRRIALAWAVSPDTIRPDTVYDYTLEAATFTPGRVGNTATGKLIVVDRRGSGFGAGWSLAGLERIRLLANGQRLWVGGDGSARVYQVIDSSTWVASADQRPDTLKRVGGTQYYRTVPGGAKIWFSTTGQHDSTVNRLGQRTKFVYTNGLLTSITLPDTLITQPGGKVYSLAYDSSAPPKRVVTITAPGSRITKLFLSALRVDSIQDPDNSKVRFTYENGTSRRIASRTDRRGTVTSFTYDVAKKVSRVHTNLQPDSIRIGFAAIENQGLSIATPRTAIDTANAYTAFSGARQYATRSSDTVSQQILFYTERFGATRRLRDALNQWVTVRREDGQWPALPTEAAAPNGFVIRAGYDVRGNIVRSVMVNPLGDGRDTVTHYHWNATWDVVDSVVTPMGVTTTMAYDATNGNRLWQQLGSDPARRVAFRYGNAQKLLSSMILPLTPADSIVYDGQWNLAGMRTPLGFWTSYYKDAIGRDTLVVTPIDSTDVSRGGAADSTIRLRQRVVYTVMDRDSVSQTIAPNRVQTLSVEKSRDPEGNVLSLSRWSIPDPNAIVTITTRWRYDRANRPVAEIAPDDSPTIPRIDSTDFDPAGNVVKALTRRNDPTGGTRLTISMTYDALNRLTQRTVPQVHYGQRFDGIPRYQAGANVPSTPYPFYPNDGGSGYLVPADVATFTYDITGGLRTASNGAAQIARGYYPNGAIKADTQRIRTVSGTDFDQHRYILQYTYDLDGRRVDLIHPSQLAAGAVRDRTTHAYDPSTGLPASVTDVMGNVFQLGYDVNGQLTSLTSPGGISETDTYDGDGRRRTQQLLNGSSSAYKWPESYLRNASFGYDARGKTARVYNTAGTADTLFTQYSGLGHVVLDSMRTRGKASLVYPDGGIGPFPIKYDAFETFSLDAFGNLRQANATTRVWNGPQNYQTVPSLRLDQYDAGVGRLARQQADYAIDTLVYDEAGNTIWMSTLSNTFGTAYQDRASYYGADGRLVAADRRSVTSYRSNFEESRYDALGRRVWVRSRNACVGSGADPLCRLSKIRRIVWDRDHELYEIQMPGGDADGTWLENDVAQVQLPVVIADENGLRYDLNPYFGRVAYTTGLAIDQPLSVIRFGYRSVLDQNDNAQPALDWATFAIMPRWTTRGLADVGTFDDGGVDRCTTFQGVQRCIWVDWPAQVYAYARNAMRRNAWHGSVTEDKADAAGTYYRRNRLYDPATGRFTQEDPIGLAGGLNLYGFAGGDPVNFSDPFGLCYPMPTCIYFAMWFSQKYPRTAEFISTLVEQEAAGFQCGSMGFYECSVPPSGTFGALVGWGTLGLLTPALRAPGLTVTAVERSVPLSLGSTGRTAAVDLSEQLAMAETMSNPAAGTVTRVRMADPRWLESEGWVKMSRRFGNIEIHYVRNRITGAVDDFKFVNP